MGEGMYRVFLVDNEEGLLAELSETLPWSEHGFVVAGAESDPARMEERIMLENPEVVCGDLNTARKNGQWLMHRLKARGLCPEFVMVSSCGNFEDARTFFQHGGFDYLVRPLERKDADALLGNLKQRLEKKKVLLAKSASVW